MISLFQYHHQPLTAVPAQRRYQVDHSSFGYMDLHLFSAPKDPFCMIALNVDINISSACIKKDAGKLNHSDKTSDTYKPHTY